MSLSNPKTHTLSTVPTLAGIKKSSDRSFSWGFWFNPGIRHGSLSAVYCVSIVQSPWQLFAHYPLAYRYTLISDDTYILGEWRLQERLWIHLSQAMSLLLPLQLAHLQSAPAPDLPAFPSTGHRVPGGRTC